MKQETKRHRDGQKGRGGRRERKTGRKTRTKKHRLTQREKKREKDQTIGNRTDREMQKDKEAEGNIQKQTETEEPDVAAGSNSGVRNHTNEITLATGSKSNQNPGGNKATGSRVGDLRRETESRIQGANLWGFLAS